MTYSNYFIHKKENIEYKQNKLVKAHLKFHTHSRTIWSHFSIPSCGSLNLTLCQQECG